MRGRAGPVTEISAFASTDRDIGNRLFSVQSAGTRLCLQGVHSGEPGRNGLGKIASLSQHSGRNGIIFVLYVLYFHLRRMGISFSSLVKLQESRQS